MEGSLRALAVERALSCYRPNRNARARLFCFPHAGGSAGVFAKMASILSATDFDVCCVELPGRGNRLDERPIDNLNEMVAHMADVIAVFHDLPFAFLGYSMGATIALELVHLLVKHGRPLPRSLYLAAASPPEMRDKSELLHELSDHELVTRISEYNGTPQEILSSMEIMALLLPTMRADFRLIEMHSPDRIKTLSIPIAVIIGSADPHVEIEDAVHWQNHTTADFELHTVDGDHFFILSAADRLASIICRRGI